MAGGNLSPDSCKARDHPLDPPEYTDVIHTSASRAVLFSQKSSVGVCEVVSLRYTSQCENFEQ